MRENIRPNLSYKLIRSGQIVERCQTHLKRRFLNKLRSIKWKDKDFKVYLKVSYGQGKNDGEYFSKEELLAAFAAFTEK